MFGLVKFLNEEIEVEQHEEDMNIVGDLEYDLRVDEEIEGDREMVDSVVDKRIAEDDFSDLFSDFYHEEEEETIPKLTSSLLMVTWLCLFLAMWQYIFGIMPPSLYLLMKRIGINVVIYKKYVVCIKCFKLYKLEDYIVTIQGNLKGVIMFYFQIIV